MPRELLAAAMLTRALFGSLQHAKSIKTALYAGVGMLISLLAAAFYSSIHAGNRWIDELTAELGRDLEVLIGSGESDTLEFKSTLRWNLNEQRRNRALEMVIMKAAAGYLDGRGAAPR